MRDSLYNLAIVGGGVNGAGLARDAAGRGASVILFEQGDLAEQTSSRSTKLIHGGLRYLEHYAFRLVREALRERETIWRIAPHVVRPMRFVLPYTEGLRPFWMLRAGLFLYDHIGGRRDLPATRTLDLAAEPAGAPLNPRLKRGFEYSDCAVDDARLVILNARDAADRGAEIRLRERVIAVRYEAGAWRIESDRRTVRAGALVNAAGPWVQSVLTDVINEPSPAPVRLVRGSHAIVRKLYDHDRAYILQNTDRRIVFLIPYEEDFTLIGTTDADYKGDPAHVRITAEEIDYLCAAANAYLRAAISPSDVVWSYSGVRALYDDGAAAAQDATRDYVLKLSASHPGLLSIFGGKITTYRRLAEHALDMLPIPAASGPRWTGAAPLPGGDFTPDQEPALLKPIRARAPGMEPAHAQRLLRCYGTEAPRIAAGRAGDLSARLTFAEVDHLIAREWAQTADDILWRRTKLGLTATQAETAALGEYVQAALQKGCPANA